MIERYRLNTHSRCLDRLGIPARCPTCRERTLLHDIRKLHVDRDPSEHVAVTPQIDSKSQHLLEDIARIINGSMGVNEARGVFDECNAYCGSQPGNQVPLFHRF